MSDFRDTRVRRVLMTVDAVGGVWTYALTLARGLSARGVRVLLAAMGPKPKASQRAEAAAIFGVELREGGFALEWMHDPWADVQRAGRWLVELEREFQPDVVHLNGFAHAAWPFRAPTLVVAHSCVVSWWQAVHGTLPPSSYDTYRTAVRWGLDRASHVVVPTIAMGDALVRAHGPVRRSVVRNGLLDEPQSRARTSVPPGEPVVLGVGRVWDEAKNLRLLGEVGNRLSVPVAIAGDATGPDGQTVPIGNVELLGRLDQEEVHAWMERAAVFCAPSLYEPFGLAVLEAAQRGCALVLSDIPSFRELWADAALYVPARDPGAWASTVERLLKNPALLRHLRSRALRRAREFGAEAMVEGYVAVYQSLTAGAHDRGRNLRAAGPSLTVQARGHLA